ncbi:MAG: DUF4390 domain-containing protein, partial [Acidobacteriota bacterium]
MRHAGILAIQVVSMAVLTVILLVALERTPATSAQLPMLEAVTTDGEVALSFRLDGVFDEDFRRKLESGLPTGFVFELRLVKHRKRWWDRTLETRRFQVAAMYNAITREYLINYKLDGRLVESRVVVDPNALEPAMTEFDDLASFTLDDTTSAFERLRVRARAELGRRLLLG